MHLSLFRRGEGLNSPTRKESRFDMDRALEKVTDEIISQAKKIDWMTNERTLGPNQALVSAYNDFEKLCAAKDIIFPTTEDRTRFITKVVNQV